MTSRIETRDETKEPAATAGAATPRGDDVLEYRREAMIRQLNDRQETVDPCERGHVEHGPEAHLGRRLVHTVSPHGFGADWDYADAVAFIQSATDIGVSVEPPRRRSGHVAARGADGRFIFFDLAPSAQPTPGAARQPEEAP